GPVEPERLAQSVLEVAPVREMHGTGLAGEEHERRWRDRDLRRVKELRSTALDHWRGLPLSGDGYKAVQLTRRHALASLAPDVHCRLENPIHALAGPGTDRNDRREIEERRVAPDPVDVLVER